MINSFFGAEAPRGAASPTGATPSGSPATPKQQSLGYSVHERPMSVADSDAFEKERIEILRELKRVLTLVLEQQHDGQILLSEDDPQVRELLIWVERCLWHGLRRSLVRGEQFEQDLRLTLWMVLANAQFAPQTKEVSEEDARDAQLFRSTIKEVSEMLEVKTDSGRSRAWVRLALNNGVLGLIGWMRPQDARSFYEPLSIWRSAEQKSIAVALLSSLKGLKFSLRIDSSKLDSDPEPSRRPHFLGISSMRRSPPATTPKEHSVIEGPRSREYQEKVKKEREAVEALKGKTATEQSQPVQAGAAIVSWFKGALFGSSPDGGASPAASGVKDNSPQNDARKLKPRRPPAFLGSSLGELVMDPRTCEYALLEWRIGVPRAVSSLLTLIDMEEESDPFDPRYVAEEDDPRFVAEVGSLIKRLSNRENADASLLPPALTWDKGAPALVAVAALKLFFRQLPVPVIPYDAYDALIACQKIGDVSARTRNISLLIDSIPEVHKPTLLALIDIVGRKCESKVSSTLSAANALAPALLRPRPGPEGGLGRASEAAELVSILIERREDIFATIAKDISLLRQRLDAKLTRIRQLHFDSRQKLDWPGTGDEEVWMKRAWVALAPEDESDRGLEGFAPVTDGWIRRGFRTGYMTHDFRGCGFLALKDLVHMAETYPVFTRRMLVKHQTWVPPPATTEQTIAEAALSYEDKIRRDETKTKFPFVLGAAQMSRSTIEMIGIDPKDETFNPKHVSELSTWPLFDEEDAAGHIFSLAMRLLDFEWTKQNAVAMDFNRIRREVVLKMAAIIDSSRPRTISDFRVALQKSRVDLKDMVPAAIVSAHRGETKSGPSDRLPSPHSSKQASGGGIDIKDRRGSVEGVVTTLHQPHHNELLPRLVVHFPNVEETILTPSHVAAIESSLPSEYRGYDWELVFSNVSHGFNLNAFFEQAKNHDATIFVLSDAETKSVFGSFCSEQWANKGDEYYGTGQSFLFSFFGGQYKDFKWTHANNYFMLSNDDCVAVGQGTAGFGLYLDSDLRNGTTSPCSTYGNDTPLIINSDEGLDGANQEFTCKGIELWTFIPKTVAKRRSSSVASNA